MRQKYDRHRSNQSGSSLHKEGKTSQTSPVRVHISSITGRSMLLAGGDAKSLKKKPPGIAIPCRCGHPKSIHARMYGNPALGTPCNFPECRCKAYRSA